MFSPEQQRVIVEEGHRAGITVQTHTTSVESLRQALEAGVDLMQHCSITGRVAIPDATFELLRSGKAFCAVQAITKARLDVMTTAAAAGIPKRVFFGELIKVQDQNERRMIAASIPVLLATDAGIMNPDEHDALPDNMKKDESTDLGRAHFLWFKATAEKGMKPMDAIMAATANIARAYHLDREIGTLEPGKRADLLILDADPLADIMNVEKIATVMKDGLVVDRAVLPLKRVLTRP
jgi:imidazolonepropionase-like amidohydrolase